MNNENGDVQTLDAVVRRLKYLHDTQLIPWRKIAQRPEYEGIPHGTLWSIAHGREPADNEQRRVLGLPPRTVPVPPCAECGKVHERLHTCDEQRQRSKRTKANGWVRRAAWMRIEDAQEYDRLLVKHETSTEEILAAWLLRQVKVNDG